MTDEQNALSRRAVACKGWRWMPGIRTQRGLRLGVVWGMYNVAAALSDGTQRSAISETVFLVDELPDLTDPATLGCLLALVREAWGVTHLSTYPWQRGWEVVRVKKGTSAPVGFGGYWPTEAEALVAALEAAPNVSDEHRNES